MEISIRGSIRVLFERYNPEAILAIISHVT